jgi:hypothetical protein
MSTALSVEATEPTKLQWFEIKDDSERVWRYEQRGNPKERNPRVDVLTEFPGSPALRVVLAKDELQIRR